MDDSTVTPRSGFNPVLALVVALPLIAVVAATTSAIIAVRGADSVLPERYHAEGNKLDADYARSAKAASLGLSADVSVGIDGECRVQLAGAASPPGTLRLDLTHATRPDLDRHVKLLGNDRQAFGAPCTALAHGHWLLELADDSAGWILRGELRPGLSSVHLAPSVAHTAATTTPPPAGG